MTAPIVRQLILKDLYLVRWMIVSAIVSGLAAVGIMPLGPVTAYVGGVSLICVIVDPEHLPGDDRRRAGAQGKGPLCSSSACRCRPRSTPPPRC